jgi:hypothetical protein
MRALNQVPVQGSQFLGAKRACERHGGRPRALGEPGGTIKLLPVIFAGNMKSPHNPVLAQLACQREASTASKT